MKKAHSARELAETLRSAARRAIMGLERDGNPLSEIIKNALVKSPLEGIRALSTLIPKQLEVEHKRDALDELSDDELRELISRVRAGEQGRGQTEGEVLPQESGVVH